MKQVAKTPQIIQHLQSAFGAEADPATYAVYEAIALNQNPIRQKHPLFEGAIAQDSMLRDIVAAIALESAPLQLQHSRGDLPSGRVFHAELHNGEVRTLFAINNTPEAGNAKIIADLDAGIIDQVSVNVMAKSLQCSHEGCGWDYLGADASYMNILNAECGNEHKLREDGTYIRMEGLDYLAEISLVGSGGADGARIVGKDNQFFASDSAQRLAASGLAPAMLLANLTAASAPTPEGNSSMTDMTALVAAAAEDKAKVMTLTASLDTSTALVATHEATIADLNTQLVAANTARDEAINTAKPSQAVLDFIADAAKKALIAKGDQTPTVPESVEDQIAAITSAGVMLSMIPVDGAAKTGADDVEGKLAPAGNSAFSRAK